MIQSKTTKEPVLLTVLIQTAKRRWYVAGITLDGRAVPLMCSEAGNLDLPVGGVLDDEVSFLRHRLSGVLQRGCDRLWGRQMKPRQIIFVVDDDFESSNTELTQQVADHFVEWMASPSVAFFACENGWSRSIGPNLNRIAGEMDQADQEVLAAGLPQLITAFDDRELWEIAPTKPIS